MKHYLLSNQDREVTVFRFSLNDSTALIKFRWENENEFSYNSAMYDVLQKKVSDNQLTIYCILDENETTLIDNYEKANQENNTASKQKWVSILKLIPTAFIPVAFTEYSCTAIFDPQACSNYLLRLISHPNNVITPPPKII